MSYQRTKTLGRYGAQLSAPTVTSFTFPASVGGVNAVDSLMMMPAEDSIYSYNLMPSEYGMQLRKGYKEWATNCIDDATKNHDIRTILPFESNSQLLEFNKLFGVTSERHFLHQQEPQGLVFRVNLLTMLMHIIFFMLMAKMAFGNTSNLQILGLFPLAALLILIGTQK